MSQELFFTFLYTLAFGVILAAGEILHAVLKVHTEYTRKFAHSAASLLALTFPLVYDSYGYVMAMGILFFLVLVIAKRKKLLMSINGVTRKTHGSVLLPLAISGVFSVSVWLEDTKLFVIPILIMGVSDSLASLTGMHYGPYLKRISIRRRTLNKTYLGTSVFFISAMIISVFVLHWLERNFSIHDTIAALCVAIGAALAEAFSPKGLDNFTVPFISLLILYIF
ncbi:MAG: hypothetical protein ACLFN2_05010 [Bacteroidales bacterium]